MAKALVGVKRNNDADIIDSFMVGITSTQSPNRHKQSQNHSESTKPKKNIANTMHLQMRPISKSSSNNQKDFHSRNSSKSKNYEANFPTSQVQLKNFRILNEAGASIIKPTDVRAKNSNELKKFNFDLLQQYKNNIRKSSNETSDKQVVPFRKRPEEFLTKAIRIVGILPRVSNSPYEQKQFYNHDPHNNILHHLKVYVDSDNSKITKWSHVSHVDSGIHLKKRNSSMIIKKGPGPLDSPFKEQMKNNAFRKKSDAHKNVDLLITLSERIFSLVGLVQYKDFKIYRTMLSTVFGWITTIEGGFNNPEPKKSLISSWVLR